MENNDDKTNTHTHTDWHTVLRHAKSVRALVRPAAGDWGAGADCFLVSLVQIHRELQELPALKHRVPLTRADELNADHPEAETLQPSGLRSALDLLH